MQRCRQYLLQQQIDWGYGSLRSQGRRVAPPATAHTAILRCRTGAPTVRLSAASMMALASMP